MAGSVGSMPTVQRNESIVDIQTRDSSTSPSILGMYAFAAATFLVATHMVHWVGTAQSTLVLFPAVLLFGLAEFHSATGSFQARDIVSVVMNATWGTFWTAFGVLELLIASGRVSRPQGAFPELGFWFIVMAAITWGITVASRRNPGVSTTLVLLAVGSTLEAIAEIAGLVQLRTLGGYFLIASAIVAWYVANGMMLQLAKRNKVRSATQPEHKESGRAA
jgi:succinate-acetate transporter protein